MSDMGGLPGLSLSAVRLSIDLPKGFIFHTIAAAPEFRGDTGIDRVFAESHQKIHSGMSPPVPGHGLPFRCVPQHRPNRALE